MNVFTAFFKILKLMTLSEIWIESEKIDLKKRISAVSVVTLEGRGQN